jgi:class 3 adenylate cyclase
VSCGARVVHAAQIGVRKVVTVLSCDVVGSTTLVTSLDPEALRGFMEHWFSDVSQALVRHGGTVEKFVGDAVLAVFGAPVGHEDDALRACRAALEILATTDTANQFKVRVGVETGEVLVGDLTRGSTFASGPPLVLATRLQSAAGEGECLVGPVCYEHIRDNAQVTLRPGLALKGLGDTVDVALLEAVSDTAHVARPLLGRFVGRAVDLSMLRQVFDEVVEHRDRRLVTVTGTAGVGKSRLVTQWLAAVERHVVVLRGRCLSYGEGVTWWPVVEMVRGVAGLTGAEPAVEARQRLRDAVGDVEDGDTIVARLAPVAGLGGVPGPPEDTAWACRRLLEQQAQDRPVIVVVDDLQWAEPGMFVVVREIVERLRGSPVLVVVLARPELLDEHPGWQDWPDAGQVVVAVTLDPLGSDEAAELTSDLLGGGATPATAARVQELAGGNPLYLEQLVALLRERGLPADGELASLTVPPTVAVLITARLDLLPAAERSTLGVASVMGQVFYPNALAEVAGPEFAGGDVARQGSVIDALMRKGLVDAAPSDLPGQDALAFTHVLLRDAAYGGLSRAVRADLHVRFAAWLERLDAGPVYQDVTLAHRESAFRTRASLGPVDEATAELGRRTSQQMYSAAIQLLGGDDKTAISLLDRADRLCIDDGDARRELRLELAQTLLLNTTRLDDVADLCRSVERSAAAAGVTGAATRAALILAVHAQMTTPRDSRTSIIRQLAEEAVVEFEAAGNDLGLMSAYDALAEAASMHADLNSFQDNTLRAAAAAERAGRIAVATRMRLWAGRVSIGADTSANEALADARNLLPAASSRAQRAEILMAVGFSAGLLGEVDQAEAAWQRCAELAGDVGGSLPRFVTYWRARFAIACCEWAVAEALLLETIATWEIIGDLATMSTDVAYLAHVQLHRGDVNAARASVVRAMALASPEDAATRALAGGAQGWLAALDGDRATAERLGATARTTLPDQAINDHVLLRLAAARGALLFGDLAQAEAQRAEALELLARKQNRVAAAKMSLCLPGL